MRGRRAPSVDFSRPISPRLQARVSDLLMPEAARPPAPDGVTSPAPATIDGRSDRDDFKNL